MPAAKVTLNGVIYPKGRTANDQPIPVTFVGDAWLTDLSVGGGPMPPEGPVDPGYSPPWARPPVDPGYSPPWATVPPGWEGGGPPGIWGPTDPRPTPPIYWPGFPNWPPSLPKPPDPPQAPSPGDPTTPVPPPAGSAGWPVQPITPPPYIIVNYPGVGPVVVAPPATNATTPPSH